MPATHDHDASSDDLAYARSLRASQARRRQTAARRRRIFRGKGTALVACGVLMTGGGAAVAQTGGASPSKPATSSSKKVKAHSASTIKDVQEALGIKADGVSGPKTRSAIRKFQRKKGMKADGRLRPSVLKALDIDAAEEPATSGSPAEPVPAELAPQLEKIAQCESDGDPTAVSPSGQYRGKYQFDQSTWESMGGTGDPAAAPEAEQDSRAAKLLAGRGPSAWPNCA